MKRNLPLLLIALFCVFISEAQVVYNHTGSLQTYTVPAGVTSVDVWLWGAGGGGGDRGGANNAGSGGAGAFVKGALAVTPGQVLQIIVGGRGTYDDLSSHAGGYGGGGTSYGGAGSGGGYSGIFVTGAINQTNARVIAAGGGGGAYGRPRNFGGGGGATTGGNGAGLNASYTGGGGASITVAGVAGTGAGVTSGNAGAVLQGGAGGDAGFLSYAGGGGGGGYFGGGGGYSSYSSGGSGQWGSGGGGGSSFVGGITGVTNTAGGSNNTGVANNPGGITETFYNGTAGVGGQGNANSGGHGLVVIRPALCSGAPVISGAAISATSGAPGSAITLTASISSSTTGLSYQWQSGPAVGGPWTNIAGATSNPANITAPLTLGTTTYYRVVVTCSNGGASTNSTSTLVFTTNSCVPSSSSSSTYIRRVRATLNGSTWLWDNNLDNWATPSGFGNYFSTPTYNTNISAGGRFWIELRLAGTGGASSVVVWIDWNADGVFEFKEIDLGASGIYGNGYTVLLPINVPSNATIGEHRMRIMLDYNNFDPGTYLNDANPCLLQGSPTRGEVEDYKITVTAGPNCSTTPSITTYYEPYIESVQFKGTISDPPANNSTYSGSGYSDYSSLPQLAVQEQGEGINVDVTNTNYLAHYVAWVDWNKNGFFESPSECVYSIPTVAAYSTTFGFQIPLSAAPGNYKLRIRIYDEGTAAGTPISASPCGSMIDGETEDYLFTVRARCNARIASVTDQTLCGSTPLSFTLNTTGTTGTTGFNWYSGPTGGSPLSGSVFAGGIPPAGNFTTPPISANNTYYVAASGLNTVGGACESPRIPVKAIYNATSPLQFTPPGPIFVCQGAGLTVEGSSSTETKVLVSEDFESGGLGLFSVGNITAPTPLGALMQWRNRTSVFVPSYTSVWQPAISSGFGTNKFAFATSDLSTASINTTLFLNTAVSTVGFTSLMMEFDIFFDIYPGGEAVYLEFSNNNFTGIAHTVTYNTTDLGIGTSFAHQIITLPAALYNQTNLRFRIRYQSGWTNGVALDNIKLYGTAPTSTSYTWQATGPGADPLSMYSDPGFVNHYIAGTNLSSIYVNPTSTQVAAGNDLNFQASLTLSNGCVTTGTITIKLNDKVWTGAENGDWHNPDNWCGDIVPTLSTSVFIPASATNMPVISAATPAYARKVEIASGASLTINAATNSLEVRGDFINSGTLTNNGRIALSGTSATAQQFPGSGTISAMHTLEINNTGAGVNLNNNITINKELKPTAGILNLGSSDIIISSRELSTAEVSQLGSTAGFTYGSGGFIIERYLKEYKGWRFLAAPVKGGLGSKSITDSWREGGAPVILPNGYGLQLTGPGGTANGLDQASASPSMKWYDSTTNTYIGVTHGSALIANPVGYMVFVRGDRSVGITSAPTPTNLRIKGEILTGDQSFPIGKGKTISVGNPYPSAIDMGAVLSANTGVDNFYVAWDPSIGGAFGVGGYQTISGSDFEPTAADPTSDFYITGQTYQNVQSGQVIYLVNNAAAVGTTLIITEAMKASGSTSAISRETNSPADRNYMRTKLYNATGSILDGNAVLFDEEFSSTIDRDDAIKFSNSGENFGLLRSGKKLAIEARGRVVSTDTIFYNMSNIKVADYKLAIAPKNFNDPLLTAFMVDKFLNTTTAVSITDSSFISFSGTTAAASRAADRFMMVFRRSTAGPVPVTILSISANRNADRSVAIHWKVDNEINMLKYEVERSADGANFQSILTTAPTAVNGGSAAYLQTDLSPLAADNFYRIKAVSIDGQVQYSAIVKVADIGTRTASVTVSPNPVENKQMNVSLVNQPKGGHTVELISANGQVVFRSVITVNYANQKETIQLGSILAAGRYQLRLTSETGDVTSQSVIVQ